MSEKCHLYKRFFQPGTPILRSTHQVTIDRFPFTIPGDMTAQIPFLILSGLLVVAGIIGLVLPAFPGAILLFLGFLLAAWTEDFVHIGLGTLIGIWHHDTHDLCR